MEIKHLSSGRVEKITEMNTSVVECKDCPGNYCFSLRLKGIVHPPKT